MRRMHKAGIGMIQGTIFNIQRFSLHDGPGIRTTVFLKGCPLDCAWCHNPESKKAVPQLAFSLTHCIGCRRCAAVCENNAHVFEENDRRVRFDACAACGKCIEVCPTGAVEIFGRRETAENIWQEAARDIPFYETSGGGLTVSGGEPAMQAKFTAEILRLAKAGGVHTAIETAGHAPWSAYEAMLPHLDMVLFDIKQMNTALHKAYTGQDNFLIHENLTRLCKADQKAEIVVRTPVIPGYNDDAANFEQLAEFLLGMERIPRVEILPYNPLAGSKHPRLGMKYTPEIEENSGNKPESLQLILENRGLNAKVMH